MAKRPTNDQILIEEVVKQKHNQQSPEIEYPDYFEVFSAEQILKNQDLGYDELLDGVIGGGRDGGIDYIYMFINGDYVREDYEFSLSKTKPTVDVFFGQVKTSKRYEETAIEKIKLFITDFMDLSIGQEGLAKKYNSDVVDKIVLFQTMVKALASKFPRYRFQMAYVTMGDSPSDGLLNQAREAKFLAEKFARDAVASFDLILSLIHI